MHPKEGDAVTIKKIKSMFLIYTLLEIVGVIDAICEKAKSNKIYLCKRKKKQFKAEYLISPAVSMNR